MLRLEFDKRKQGKLIIGTRDGTNEWVNYWYDI